MTTGKWDCVILREICDSVNYGYTASAKPEPIGPKFLRITDIVPDRIDWSSVPYCKINEKDIGKYRLEKDDIVIARTGATTGYAKRMRDDYTAVFASYLVRVRVNPKHDSQYVGFVVESDEYRQFIQLNLSGTAQPQANAQVLTSFPIPLPPLPTQRKIAAVLSTYDGLIENNTRRIKILEEMASAIYREWFIEFRFPGHEQVEIVEPELGLIPQGWEVVRTEQIIKRVQSGKKYNQKTVEQAGNIPVLDQGQSGIIGYHNDVPGVIASEDEPIIVFANHTCYQRIIQFPFSAIQNVLPFLPHPEKHRNIYWLHWATKDLVELNDYKGHWPEFMSKELPLPPASLCEQFGEFIKPMVQLTYRLEKRNQNLRQTRDLLLPKLISGELDVSELDINID